MKNKKPLTKSERMTKLYVKFYKQQRTLYLKQFKKLAEFHQIEDREKFIKKVLHDKPQSYPSFPIDRVQ